MLWKLRGLSREETQGLRVAEHHGGHNRNSEVLATTCSVPCARAVKGAAAVIRTAVHGLWSNRAWSLLRLWVPRLTTPSCEGWLLSSLRGWSPSRHCRSRRVQWCVCRPSSSRFPRASSSLSVLGISAVSQLSMPSGFGLARLASAPAGDQRVGSPRAPSSSSCAACIGAAAGGSHGSVSCRPSASTRRMGSPHIAVVQLCSS